MNWLATLNESQFKAVVHPGGPLFVVAGAGTGKTKTLTSRIAYLIMNGANPSRILAVTFTNKAAREMKERVINMTGPHAMDVWLYTFHALGLNILRRHIAELPYGYRPNFNVIDEDDGKKIIQDVIKQLELDVKMFSLKNLKNLILPSEKELAIIYVNCFSLESRKLNIFSWNSNNICNFKLEK